MFKVRRLAPIVIIAVGIAGMVAARMLTISTFEQPGPGLWPLLVAAALTLTGGILLFLDRAADYERWTAKSGQAGVAGLGLAVFVLLFQVAGFTTSCLLLVLLWLRWFERASWVRCAAISALAVVVLQILFVNVLGVPFPDDILLEAVNL